MAADRCHAHSETYAHLTVRHRHHYHHQRHHHADDDDDDDELLNMVM